MNFTDESINKTDAPNARIQDLVEYPEPAANGSLVIGERVKGEAHARIEILPGRICDHHVGNVRESFIC